MSAALCSTRTHLRFIVFTLGLSCRLSPFRFQVPLVIFKREKELARKLEFDGVYVTEQPEDDDIKGQWDRLVLNTP